MNSQTLVILKFKFFIYDFIIKNLQFKMKYLFPNTTFQNWTLNDLPFKSNMVVEKPYKYNAARYKSILLNVWVQTYIVFQHKVKFWVRTLNLHITEYKEKVTNIFNEGRKRKKTRESGTIYEDNPHLDITSNEIPFCWSCSWRSVGPYTIPGG